MSKLAPENNREAIRLLEQAIVIAPEYGRAYAILAWCEWCQALGWWAADTPGTFGRALAHAERAVALDPNEPWARVAYGMSLSTAGEHERALGQLETMVELNPSFALGHTFRGVALLRAGMSERAAEATAKALRLSPIDDFSGFCNAFHGLALMACRRFEEAIAFSRKSVATHPQFTGHWGCLTRPRR